MSESGEMISSKELMDREGISRATLNNYIKLGILPSPVVQKPVDGMKGTKRIGYFPRAVVERLAMVKTLKKEGNTIDMIAQRFRSEGSDDRRNGDSQKASLIPRRDAGLHGIIGRDMPVYREDAEKTDALYVPGEEDDLETPAYLRKVRTSFRFQPDVTGDRKLTLDTDMFEAEGPAYFLNYQFEVEWANRAAEELYFRSELLSIDNSNKIDVFGYFLKAKLEDKISNWKDVFDFHMALLKSFKGLSKIPSLHQGLSEEQKKVCLDSFNRVEGSFGGGFQDVSLEVEHVSGDYDLYRVCVLILKDGILFLYTPDRAADVRSLSPVKSWRKDVLPRHLLTNRTAVSVLVGDIQHFQRFRTALPSGEYFELMNRIHRRLDRTAQFFNGVRGQRDSDGVIYYFFSDGSPAYMENAVACALEMKKRMKIISEEWCTRKNWDYELFLNIGISEGDEYVGAVKTISGIAVETAGDIKNGALAVAHAGGDGSIMVTKNLVDKMEEGGAPKFRYGIRRKSENREYVAEKTFSRVADMAGISSRHREGDDIGSAISVTEIIDGTESRDDTGGTAEVV